MHKLMLMPPPPSLSLIRQAWPDFNEQIDEIMSISGKVNSIVFSWYKKHQTEENKDKVKQFMVWRSKFLDFADEVNKSGIVAPTQELLDRISAYREELKQYINKFKNIDVDFGPIVVPEHKEENKEKPSEFWSFIKFVGYAGAGIGLLYAGSEFLKSWKGEKHE